MALYLGEIVLKKEYVNYEPYFIYEDGKFKFLNKTERRELLPESEFTNINLSTPNGGSFALQGVFRNKEFCFLEYDFANLEPSLNAFGERNKTGYKITVTPEILTNCFHDMSWRNFYRLLEVCDIEGDFRTNQTIFISDNADYVVPNSQVYIRIDENMAAGPFTAEENNGRLCITTNEPSRRFVAPVRKFPAPVSDYTQEFNAYSNYQTFIRIDDESKSGFLDTASDEELLKNFRDYVNLDSAKNGKIDLADWEKIARSYSNSLFAGANVPREVLAKRYERLMKIFAAEKEKADMFTKMDDDIKLLEEEKIRRAAEEAAKQNAEDEAHRAEVEKQISELEARKSDAEKQVTEAEARQAEAEKQAAEAETRHTEAEKQIAESEARRAELEKEVSELEMRRAEAEKVLSELAERHAELEEQISELEARRTEAKEQAEKQREERPLLSQERAENTLLTAILSEAQASNALLAKIAEGLKYL